MKVMSLGPPKTGRYIVAYATMRMQEGAGIYRTTLPPGGDSPSDKTFPERFATILPGPDGRLRVWSGGRFGRPTALDVGAAIDGSSLIWGPFLASDSLRPEFSDVTHRVFTTRAEDDAVASCVRFSLGSIAEEYARSLFRACHAGLASIPEAFVFDFEEFVTDRAEALSGLGAFLGLEVPPRLADDMSIERMAVHAPAHVRTN